MSTMLYRCPGPHRLHDVDCEYVIVGDDEIDSHLSGGWHRTPTEAGAHKPSAAPDPERAQAEALAARNAADAQAIAGVRAWAGRATLEAKARELGLKFDGRTSDKRLQAMIEAA